jgi:undecaprenyl pyrophosphate synthase
MADHVVGILFQSKIYGGFLNSTTAGTEAAAAHMSGLKNRTFNMSRHHVSCILDGNPREAREGKNDWQPSIRRGGKKKKRMILQCYMNSVHTSSGLKIFIYL